MILNQIRSGLSCPRDVEALRKRIPDGSLMCYVEVHAWSLAMVLDRLEALEQFQTVALILARRLERLSEKPKG